MSGTHDYIEPATYRLGGGFNTGRGLLSMSERPGKQQLTFALILLDLARFWRDIRNSLDESILRKVRGNQSFPAGRRRMRCTRVESASPEADSGNGPTNPNGSSMIFPKSYGAQASSHLSGGTVWLQSVNPTDDTALIPDSIFCPLRTLIPLATHWREMVT